MIHVNPVITLININIKNRTASEAFEHTMHDFVFDVYLSKDFFFQIYKWLVSYIILDLQ